MNLLDLARLQYQLNEQGILMSFSGPFSHSIIEELGKAVKNHLESMQMTRSVLMDVFAVYIEQAQNVRNYVSRWEKHPDQARLMNSGIVVIARESERYIVSSGNLLSCADMPTLVERLDQLRTLDKAGLKALYKEQMRQPLTAEGRAGLGLTEMARKASEPLQHTLSVVDERYLFFSLRVVI